MRLFSKQQFVILVLLVLTGCASGTHLGPLLPAQILDLSDTDRETLQSNMAQLLDIPTVKIGPSAFSDHHTLVLGHTTQQGLTGNLASGHADPPVRFHLLSDGESCVLRHVSSGEQVTINVACTQLSL